MSFSTTRHGSIRPVYLGTALLLALISFLLVPVFGHAGDNLLFTHLKFAVIADPHVYNPALGMEGDSFEQAMTSEIKLFEYSDRLLQAALQDVALAKVDFLIIPGDLTKDGERSSHLLLAEHLDTLQAQGIPAFVVPGNHDIYNPDAVRFYGPEPSPTETISADEFSRIYADFGYSQAIDRDTHSLSYVAEHSPGFWLLALDSCRYAENVDAPITAGALQPGTRGWIAHVLKQARAKQKKVIAFMHHTVVENFPGHADLLPEFIVDDFENISRSLAQSGAPLIFTGHTHVQDATFKAWNDGSYVLDIQTGSLVTYPHPYRIVRVCGGLINMSSRFTTLPGDFHGSEFAAYSQSFTADSLHLKAEDMGLWWPLDTIFAQAAWAHMLGDEQPSSETLQTISMLQSSSLPVFQTAGAYLDAIWKDSPPADNDCLVFLPWNMLNSFDVLYSLLKQIKLIQPLALPPANLTYFLGLSAQKTFFRIDGGMPGFPPTRE